MRLCCFPSHFSALNTFAFTQVIFADELPGTDRLTSWVFFALSMSTPDSATVIWIDHQEVAHVRPISGDYLFSCSCVVPLIDLWVGASLTQAPAHKRCSLVPAQLAEAHVCLGSQRVKFLRRLQTQPEPHCAVGQSCCCLGCF